MIGSATSATAMLQLSQQLQMALAAVANTTTEEQAVSAALLGGAEAGASANPNLGQLVNLSV
jgi:hypothetical protein